jgi:DNA-binding NtrC family response regulator
MFERLRPYVRTPILSWVPRQVPEPPTSAGTLVIRGVETLTAAQQQRVLALNGRTLRDIQIVSIAGSPLYPFVRRGLFLDRLYYQLNVVFFDLSGSI